jgi:hypothetical protein
MCARDRAGRGDSRRRPPGDRRRLRLRGHDDLASHHCRGRGHFHRQGLDQPAARGLLRRRALIAGVARLRNQRWSRVRGHGRERQGRVVEPRDPRRDDTAPPHRACAEMRKCEPLRRPRAPASTRQQDRDALGMQRSSGSGGPPSHHRVFVSPPATAAASPPPSCEADSRAAKNASGGMNAAAASRSASSESGSGLRSQPGAELMAASRCCATLIQTLSDEFSSCPLPLF